MFDTYDRIFDVRAGSYQAAMERVPHARDAEFAAAIAPIDPRAGTRLYDMPSGGGYLHRHLPPGVRYTAIEPSAVFARHCPAGPDCATVASSIEAVPLPAGAADAIVSLAGLHHCPDLNIVFAEMRRLIRRGGKVAILDVARDTPPAGFLNGFVAAHNPIGHDGRFLDGATAGLLGEAGLHVGEDGAVDVPWRFAGRAQAGAYCAALFGLAGVTPREVADAMAAEIGFDEGRDGCDLRWSLRRIVCTAA